MKVVRQRSARLLAILSILLLTAVIAPPVHGAPKPEGSKVILTVRYGHDELASSLGIESVSIAHALTKAKREPASGVIGLPDVAVSLVNGQKESIYRLEPTGMLWDPAAQQRLVPDAATAHKLVAYANQLRSNHYGAMIEWSDVRKLVPLKQIFTITDMGTGMSFRVQRRAGSDHADVQPISKADSHMMKKIYNDHWSWNRRAVLVHSGQYWIAGSMNGMPHGGDGIPDNDFSGHFCLHFLGSTTHKSETPDLAHQLMVHKAGGQLRSMLDGASPLQLAESVVEALNHHDQDLLLELAIGLPDSEQASLLTEMHAIRSIRVNKNKDRKPPIPEDQSLSAQVQLSVSLLKQNESEHRATYTFTFERESTSAGWRMKQVIMK
ncbi:conserved hypothetical protein [Paenibacillus curdlanolyticus YK9]|uniref:Copper amine oxidase domain protein n=1 Tax=Paenibacillus curdlanolyticus YK9 TaxID=717606 RepID=E0ICR8_9BACL|nr:hypothetical protein [Paenibacillus curdlanolyticus]EFM09954.1 conserved hypothetical protein [Paenibacillus curdlanolyticus YK9]